MQTILVYGHEDLEYDNGAVKLISFLKENLPESDYIIKKASRPEQMMDFLGRDFLILDVAKGIDRPIAITDVDQLDYKRKITAHDMDLAAYLKMLKSLGELETVKIVALPYNQDPNKYKQDVIRLIKEFK